MQRQYTSPAGRIENAQVAVFATYATERGHTLIDRELYLPRCWTENSDRRAAVGVPTEVTFATKPQLAARMITRAVQAGFSVRWVAADEVYGANTALRTELETQQLGYVLAVSCDHRVTTGAGTTRADTLIASLPKRAWQRVSAGQGAHGHRFYDWALGKLAYYRCHTPQSVPVSTLVSVAGRRWTVEESFQTAKGQTGLDQHQVRHWQSWYRWTTLVLLAHAFLAVVTAAARTRPAPAGLIPLTLPEIGRLFEALLTASPDQAAHIRAWSTWRRRHQHRARQAHYQRQRIHEP